MKLYIIIASEGEASPRFWIDKSKEWDAWISLCSNNKGKKINDNKILFSGSNCVVYVRKRESNFFKNVLNHPTSFLNERINEIKTQINIQLNAIQALICFFHAESYQEINELNREITQIKFNSHPINVKWYGYTSTSPKTCQVIIELMKKIRDNEDFCKYLETFDPEKKIEEIELPKKLTHLIHRIAHIFLPLDIDLMGIVEVRNQESGDNKAIRYLEEVLKAKANLDKDLPKDNEGKPAYYRQKLAHLWYMVLHKQFNGEKAVPSMSNPEELLADGKAIIDLIDKEKREKKEVQECWKKLLKICSLKLNNDKNDPFDNNNIILDDNPPIFQFTFLLDSKIEKNNSIDENYVEGILNFFKNQNWEIKVEQENKGEGEQKNKKKDEQENKKKINSFHDWFCALMKCLDELKKILEEKDM